MMDYCLLHSLLKPYIIALCEKQVNHYLLQGCNKVWGTDYSAVSDQLSCSVLYAFPLS